MFKAYLIVFIILLNNDALALVKHVTFIFRHGDRTPVNCYPTDPFNNESLWPVAFGQLTNLGKKQHFKLGGYLRDLYEETIPKEYNSKEVYVRSTDVDRTLMSAEANMAGMFPPSGSQVWNTKLAWQPIPVHTVPEHKDEVLAMKKPCKRYKLERKEYRNSKPYLKKLKKYGILMEYLSSNTGMKVQNFDDILDIYSCLTIEQLYNFTLPEWTKPVFPKKMREPACYSFETPAATPEMARLLVGPLLNKIFTTIYDVANGTSELKLSVYSGHDFTVGTLLSAMNISDHQCPSYTATIIFELVFEEDMVFPNDGEFSPLDGYFIRILYRNTVELTKPKVIYIPECGTLCSLSNFARIYSNLITVDWETECNLVPIERPDMFHFYFGTVGLAAIPPIAVVLYVYYLWWRCYRERCNKLKSVPEKPVKFSPGTATVECELFLGPVKMPCDDAPVKLCSGHPADLQISLDPQTLNTAYEN